MHEYSIVADLVEKCEGYAHTHCAKIVTIFVGLGERSGVNAELFARAFENYTEGSSLECARLKIVPIPITIACAQCGANHIIENLEYGTCPSCKGSNVRIIEGEEMLLLRLEMDKD